jgi:hypothetical protein
MATATHSFMAIDGKLYWGSTGMAVSMVVTSTNELAKIEGGVNFDITFEKAQAYWRTRSVQDSVTYRTNVKITVDQMQFRASNLNKLMQNLTYATIGAFIGTTATCSSWLITTSTVPRQGRFVFDFVRTSDNKHAQVYAPKAEIDNFPAPFAGADFIKQNVTFTMLASGAAMMKFLQRKVAG